MEHKHHQQIILYITKDTDPENYAERSLPLKVPDELQYYMLPLLVATHNFRNEYFL